MRGCCVPRDGGLCARSRLAEQAKILMFEVEENNLYDKLDERWARWNTCSLCEQEYHGVVRCASDGGAGRLPPGGRRRTGLTVGAMNQPGNGLCAAGQDGRHVVRERGRVGYGAAPRRARAEHLHRADQSRRSRMLH